jgi:RimJ/RimL family protein N-acetyltransferase
MKPHPFPLATARLRLRPFQESDIAAFTAYRADAAVARYQSWEDFSLEDGRRFWQSQRGRVFGVPGTWFQVAIAELETDALLGDLALHFLEDPRQVELGFTLAAAQQGRGIAREAVTRMLDWLLAKGEVHRVHAVTDALNEPAHRLLRGLGFRQEAHHIENTFFKGAWGDELVFALLAREWADRHSIG